MATMIWHIETVSNYCFYNDNAIFEMFNFFTMEMRITFNHFFCDKHEHAQ